MGMIGGGGDGFIGPIHRMAAALCGNIELVAGAFSGDPERSRRCGDELFLPADRVYASFADMIKDEARLPDGDRIDFVSIVTPNHLHYPAAKLALDAGFEVICDKPATRTLAEARSLGDIVRLGGGLFCLTHTYLGYPLVSQARLMTAAGEFGEVRRIDVEYPQGWLAAKQEDGGNPQAAWRTDPQQSGISGCIADIGTHAHSLVEYMSGQQIVEVSAELTSFLPGRRLDDDGAALFRTNENAKGTLRASQVCGGGENGLRITIYGSDGGCEWRQEEPNTLIVRKANAPISLYRAGAEIEYLYPEVRAACLTPSGHPEGYIEAFSAIYRSFANELAQRRFGSPPSDAVSICPGIDDGIRGLEFVEAMVNSSKNDGRWTRPGLDESGDSRAHETVAQIQGLETA